MTYAEKLRRSALESAAWRGHQMGRFEHYHGTWLGQRLPNRHAGTAKCKICGAYASFNTYPPPNGIDIGGDAVALNCPVKNDGMD